MLVLSHCILCIADDAGMVLAVAIHAARRLAIRHIQRCGHLVAILAQLVGLVCALLGKVVVVAVVLLFFLG